MLYAVFAATAACGRHGCQKQYKQEKMFKKRPKNTITVTISTLSYAQFFFFFSFILSLPRCALLVLQMIIIWMF